MWVSYLCRDYEGHRIKWGLGARPNFFDSRRKIAPHIYSFRCHCEKLSIQKHEFTAFVDLNELHYQCTVLKN